MLPMRLDQTKQLAQLEQSLHSLCQTNSADERSSTWHYCIESSTSDEEIGGYWSGLEDEISNRKKDTISLYNGRRVWQSGLYISHSRESIVRTNDFVAHRQSMPLIPVCSSCICHRDLLIVREHKAALHLLPQLKSAGAFRPLQLLHNSPKKTSSVLSPTIGS